MRFEEMCGWLEGFMGKETNDLMRSHSIDHELSKSCKCDLNFDEIKGV